MRTKILLLLDLYHDFVIYLQVVNMERDRRKLEDDKHSIEDRSAKFEAELRLVTRERDR